MLDDLPAEIEPWLWDCLDSYPDDVTGQVVYNLPGYHLFPRTVGRRGSRNNRL